MIRQREQALAARAGAMAIAVHALLLLVLVFSFNWKNVQPMNVAQVELWDSLPEPVPAPKPLPEPAPVPPVPEVKPEPPPPVPEPEPEIVIKPEPPKPEVKPKEKPKPEKPKPDPAVKQREEEKRKLEELQKMFAEEDRATQPAPAKAAPAGPTSAANAGEVDKYVARIREKIRGNVNKQLCGEGQPELEFQIAILPTGQLSRDPVMLKGSGNPACDQAVDRAIRASDPLPVPNDPTLFSNFRNLKLKFSPNGGS
ncbi:TonB C-terminal domain-containing protein [Pseudomethylobacillus aquaticus]|uniref:TonB C-terminal domain-containing protein n=1 Tax=Pseudomethylobacillus aquaticus TaxID=2676064 RepID=A0A3N0V3E7_9PROT|nr:energy transducer TonB [Pseudomethylobacillus aquaticus]ROH87326.1 TonB C-terminal domain-containing protein [Pseudomethylobacillus aquaticus]